MKNAGGGVYDGELAADVAGNVIALTASEALAAIASPSATHHIQYMQPDRHNGGSNFAFCDGHVKWMQLSATLNPGAFLWGKRHYNGNGAPVLDASGNPVQ